MKKRDDYNRYMRNYMKRRHAERRAWAIEHLGGKCVACGETEDLQIDHINREEKTCAMGRAFSLSEKRFKEEIAKCQLLCDPCHKKKTVEDMGMLPNKGVHGHPMNYKKYGCRCAACTAANAKYDKEYRRKRKMGRSSSG